VSAKKAPISGVRKLAPSQAETFRAAVTLLSWSTVVRYVTKFFEIAKKATHSQNSTPGMCSSSLPVRKEGKKSETGVVCMKCCLVPKIV
jgi:hypothetical protein